MEDLLGPSFVNETIGKKKVPFARPSKPSLLDARDLFDFTEVPEVLLDPMLSEIEGLSKKFRRFTCTECTSRKLYPTVENNGTNGEAQGQALGREPQEEIY